METGDFPCGSADFWDSDTSIKTVPFSFELELHEWTISKVLLGNQQLYNIVPQI